MRLIFAACLLFSSAAFAQLKCPDYTGTYLVEKDAEFGDSYTLQFETIGCDKFRQITVYPTETWICEVPADGTPVLVDLQKQCWKQVKARSFDLKGSVYHITAHTPLGLRHTEFYYKDDPQPHSTRVVEILQQLLPDGNIRAFTTRETYGGDRKTFENLLKKIK